MTIEERVTFVLQNINFSEKYKNTVEKHQYQKPLLDNFDKDIVVSLIEELGYQPTYDSKENFFKVIKHLESSKLDLQLNVSLKYGLVELILAIFKEKKVCQIGGPFDYIAEILDCTDIRSLPNFNSYDTLKTVLSDVFDIFNEIVDKLCNNSSIKEGR